jgi:hypothetical protein
MARTKNIGFGKVKIGFRTSYIEGVALFRGSFELNLPLVAHLQTPGLRGLWHPEVTDVVWASLKMRTKRPGSRSLSTSAKDEPYLEQGSGICVEQARRFREGQGRNRICSCPEGR